MKYAGLALVALLVAGTAWACPTLQLYVPDGTYCDITDTWMADTCPFTLFVAGTKSGTYYGSDIKNVTLYVSVPTDLWNPKGSITISGATGEPIEVLTVNELLGFGGDTPVASPGKPSELASHEGVFPAYYWAVTLPNLKVNSAGETVPNWLPGQTGSAIGDIQRYVVSVTGFTGVHFDLAGTVRTGYCSYERRFAPFSRDAGYEGECEDPSSVIPEPATMTLVGLALVGIAPLARRRSK